MVWTGEDGNCAVLDRDHGLIWIIGCKMATRTVDTAGWAMVYEFCCVLGREATDRGELLKMFSTANKREYELIQQKERQRVTAGRVESRLAGITLDWRMTLKVVRLLLGRICWRHIEMCLFGFACHTDKLYARHTLPNPADTGR
jgi:hypothetical protein